MFVKNLIARTMTKEEIQALNQAQGQALMIELLLSNQALLTVLMSEAVIAKAAREKTPIPNATQQLGALVKQTRDSMNATAPLQYPLEPLPLDL